MAEVTCFHATNRRPKLTLSLRRKGKEITLTIAGRDGNKIYCSRRSDRLAKGSG